MSGAPWGCAVQPAPLYRRPRASQFPSKGPSSTQRVLEGLSTDLHGGLAWVRGACAFLGRGHSFLYRCTLLGNKTVHVSWAQSHSPRPGWLSGL